MKPTLALTLLIGACSANPGAPAKPKARALWKITDWTAAPSIGQPRSFHVAAPLPDGKVLIAGGETVPGASVLDTAEIFDPSTQTWSSTAPMYLGRTDATATVLGDGKILVVGGSTFGPINGLGVPSRIGVDATELYNPGSHSWTQVDTGSGARFHHTATLLADGRVLVAGGIPDSRGSGKSSQLSSAAIYNPATHRWLQAAPMNMPRAFHSATLLGNGKVLVVGGNTHQAEMFDPTSGQWRVLATNIPSLGATNAIKLNDGKVMVLSTQGQLFIFDPGTESFTPVGVAPANMRLDSHPNLTLLGCGKVLVSGYKGTSVYDPVTREWTLTDLDHHGRLIGGKFVAHTATYLSAQNLVLGVFGPETKLYPAQTACNLQQRVASNPCVLNNGGCSKYAQCSANGTVPACACKPGFTGNGLSCDDVDECAADASICGHGTCKNTIGSYLCNCAPGYVSNGSYCVGAPAVITSESKLASGAFRITGSGTAAVHYIIQASSNLNGSWADIGTVLADGRGNFTFIDNSAVQYDVRFYRVKSGT